MKEEKSMKKNKILAVVLSAAIAISLTGCGNSGGKDADSGTANSGSAGSGSEELKDTGKKDPSLIMIQGIPASEAS